MKKLSLILLPLMLMLGFDSCDDDSREPYITITNNCSYQDVIVNVSAEDEPDVKFVIRPGASEDVLVREVNVYPDGDFVYVFFQREYESKINVKEVRVKRYGNEVIIDDYGCYITD